jgi:hypothetical protein
MRPERRAALVSALLAVAAVVVVVGTTTHGKAQRGWLGGAVGVAVLALAANALPDSRLLPWHDRRRLRKERDLLVATPGWVPGVVPVVGGTLLLVNQDDRTKGIAGFLCEVHGPAGVYFGMTPEARAIAEPPIEEGAMHSLLDLPDKQTFSGLVFPRDFADAEGAPPKPSFALERGEYVALWFGWTRQISSSIRLVHLTGVAFDYGLSGIRAEVGGGENSDDDT